MRGSFRLVTIGACVIALALLAGCNGQTPPSMREDATPASSSAPAAEPQSAEPAPVEAATPAAGEASEASGAAKAAETTESKPGESEPAEGEKRSQFEGSEASAGVAVGAELQRTADWKVGGKLWAMTLDGKANAAGQQPAVQLVAVGQDGVGKAIAEIKAEAGAGSVQGNTIVQVPPGTSKLIVVTTLSPSGKPGGPELVVPLADVPTVTAFTLVGTGE